jgi:hypothetical protein
MAVKVDDEQKIPLQILSRFENLSTEETAMFDDLVVESDGEDEPEVHSPSIAPGT